MNKDDIVKELGVLTEKVRQAQERMDALQKENEALKALVHHLASRPSPYKPIETPSWLPTWTSTDTKGCPKCGIGADGKPYGYVCPRSDCPTRVTC